MPKIKIGDRSCVLGYGYGTVTHVTHEGYVTIELDSGDVVYSTVDVLAWSMTESCWACDLNMDTPQRALTVAEWDSGMGCTQHRTLRSGSCHDCAMLQPKGTEEL